MAKLTPSRIKKKKMMAALAAKKLEKPKQNGDNESEDKTQDLEIEEEVDDNSEVEAPPVKNPAKKSRRRGKKGKKTPTATPEIQDVKKVGQKRPAEVVINPNSSKKVRITVECDDQLLKLQHERLLNIARQQYAHGLDKSKLVVKWFSNDTTEAQLKEAFPKCSQIKKLKGGDGAHVVFDSEADAKEEFDDATDKVIGGKKVAVLYAELEDADDSKQKDQKVNKLMQAQYERIAWNEREKLSFGIDRLRLHLSKLTKVITEDDIKKVFPKSTKIEVKRRNAFVSFSSPADADEAFKASEDLTINEQKVNAKYARGVNCDSELVEAQYERACQIERSVQKDGICKKILNVRWLLRSTTTDELMEAFPGATGATIDPNDEEEGFVKFKTAEDARFAFDQSLNKTIRKSKVAVMYATSSDIRYLYTHDDKTEGESRGEVASGLKKLIEELDVEDEFVQAQFERIAVIERERLARGVDRLRLHLLSLRQYITEDDIKEAFPTSINVEMLRCQAFMSFSSPADADEAFEASEDLTINGITAKVKYACGGEDSCDEELLERQYERACQIEQSRLKYGVEKLRLAVKGLPKGTTSSELMEAFPGAIHAHINRFDIEQGYVNFGTVEDAKLAFDQSLQKTINEKKVAVLYSDLTEKGIKIANRKRLTAVLTLGNEAKH